jgi:hypothetical protein
MLSMANVLDDLRKAIKASDKSRYRLWLETGIGQSHLSRLMKHEAGLSVENLQTLADALGLEIIIRPKRKAATRKGE